MRRAVRAVALAAVLALATAAPAVAGARPLAAATDSGSAAPGAGATYVPVGAKIAGGSNSANGPQLRRPGQFVDTLPRGGTSLGTDGTSKYYQVQLSRGETAYFSATMILPPVHSTETNAELSLTVYDLSQSNECSFDDDSLDFETGGLIPPLSVGVSTGRVDGPGWPDTCPKGGTFVVKVTRGGQLFADQPLPVEVGYRLEPPAGSSGLPPAASTMPRAAVNAPADVQQQPGGDSFDNAPVVGPGRYDDTISSGQTRYFRVHLGWGQRLAYLINPGIVSGAGGDGTYASLVITNPVRSKVELADSSDDALYSFGGGDYRMGGSTAVPVRYNNRQSDDRVVRAYSIDGDYFLALSLGYTDTGTALHAVPYTLALSVTGASERAPSYTPGAVDAGPNPAAAATSGDSTPLVLGIIAGVLALAAIAAFVAARRSGRPRHSGNGYAPTTT